MAPKVYLYWSWEDNSTTEHPTLGVGWRRARYVSLKDAELQATYDQKNAKDTADYRQAPLLIEDDKGKVLWTPDN